MVSRARTAGGAPGGPGVSVTVTAPGPSSGPGAGPSAGPSRTRSATTIGRATPAAQTGPLTPERGRRSLARRAPARAAAAPARGPAIAGLAACPGALALGDGGPVAAGGTRPGLA